MYATAKEYLGLKYPTSSLRENYENHIPIVEQPKKMNYMNTGVIPSNPGKKFDPKVFGPHFWFSLHVSAAYYPKNPSQIVKERIKQRILAIPYELPCDNCRPHAISFVESNRDKLDNIVNSRDNLVKFYLDFHNNVNKRLGKPEWTLDQINKVYSD